MMKISASRWAVMICLVLTAAACVVYWPVRNYEFVIYDDTEFVSTNRMVLSGINGQSVRWAFTAGRGGSWNPVLWLSLMLDAELFGQEAGGYHAVNLGLHIANTLLLFGVLRMMTGALWRCAFAAAVFALHPLHVESVAWISERKDTLSTLFWLLTMAAYTRYARGGGARWYGAAIALFAAGLMTKPMLVTLPFVLLLVDYWPLERLRLEGRAVKGAARQRPAEWLIYEKIPFIALAAAVSVVTFAVQKSWGAMALNEHLGLSVRIANAFVSYASYIWKTVWPTGLAVMYPHPRGNVSMAGAAVSAVLLTAVTGLVVMYGKRKKYLAVGWLWYLGTLVPVIGLVQAGAQAMADRYTYIPQTGLVIMFSWLAGDLLGGLRRGRVILAAVAIALAGVMGVCARVQLSHWRDSTALFERALSVTKDNAAAHHNMGYLLQKEGRLDEAIVHYAEALRISPNYYIARQNMGNALLEQGRVEEAVTQYVGSMTNVPSWVSLCNNAAWEMATLPRSEMYAPEQGLRLAERVCEVTEYENAAFLDTLAAAYAATGRFDKAAKTAELAVGIARANGDAKSAERMSGRLKMYREGRAYIELGKGG